MEQLSITKTIDKCGRISIPKGVRESLGIDIGDKVIITTSDDYIQIKKMPNLRVECVFCGTETQFDFKGVSVCSDCIDEMYATV